MNQKSNPFRKRAARPQPEEIPQPKPAEMSDQEIEEGIREARRAILDAQHEELRIRERARLMPGDAPAKPRNLSEIFRKNNRRFK
jgi:hypothetical protein